MGAASFATDQQAAKLLLELLNCARQRRLRDVAPIGGTRKVQRLAQRKKGLDLIELHPRTIGASVAEGCPVALHEYSRDPIEICSYILLQLAALSSRRASPISPQAWRIRGRAAR